MIESPLIQELGAEFERAGHVKMVLHILEQRFGPAGPNITAGLAQTKEEEKLLRLSVHAGNCTSLEDFERHLREELPPPAPASTRGKRRPRKSSE